MKVWSELRHIPPAYLAEPQPEFFCEASPELAAELGLDHLG
jgi:hypothetical protein